MWPFPVSAPRGVTKGFQTYLVIDSFSQPLLAAQVALSRLHADVSQQELDLLKLAA